MVIEDGKFYFIKDEFFDVFKDYTLMANKENGNKRPCYFCFRVTSLRVVELAERGINIPFYNIAEMKRVLLEKL